MRDRLFTLLCLAALTAGCSDEGRAYRDPVDRLLAGLGFDALCYRGVGEGENRSYEFIGYDKCYHFDPPRRMRGVWLAEFEGSRFLPNAAAAPAERDLPNDSIWLEIDEDMLSPADRDVISKHPPAFAIDFVGRRATYPGRYGHGGMSRNLVVVDRLLSMRAIDPPHRPDTAIPIEGRNRR